jgi:hypothetical protein
MALCHRVDHLYGKIAQALMNARLSVRRTRETYRKNGYHHNDRTMHTLPPANAFGLRIAVASYAR